MKQIVLGITSGIAAFKTLDLIELLQAEHLNVSVIMTQKATQMVAPQEFEKLTGNKVYIDLFEEDFNYKEILEKKSVDHIELADSADVMIIVPATANIVAKIAQGIADDFLTTTLLATTAPVIICPAMNVHMWSNPLVQKNIKTLQNVGYQIIKPAKGMLACGYEGIGRLEDLQIIKDAIFNQLETSNSLKGKKILITSGGTIEPIDNVRFITNRSSGKMGVAIAEECHKRGAEVLLLRSTSSVEPRYSIPGKTFSTADELETIITEHIKDFDVMFHTAAVSDFHVENQNGKMESNIEHTLTLQPRKKILDQIKKLNSNIKLIAFKAETNCTEEELIEKAQKRLQDSNADVIVANDVGKVNQGFEADTNEVFVIFPQGIQTKQKIQTNYEKISFAPKRFIAEKLIELIFPTSA